MVEDSKKLSITKRPGGLFLFLRKTKIFIKSSDYLGFVCYNEYVHKKFAKITISTMKPNNGY